jgi:chromosome condensin MukBEF ATPase and DNA-binding subunit MukB
MSQEKVIEKLQTKYNTLHTNLNNYIKSIEPYNYYDTNMYANVFNRQRCEMLQQRLRYVQEGLERYHRNKNDLTSDLIEKDNKWMKNELKSIEQDYEKLKDFIYDSRQQSSS